MSADDRMPKGLRKAFNAAIRAVWDWHIYGGEEPKVLFDGCPYPVSDICWLTERYSDPIPEHEGAFIADLAHTEFAQPRPASASYGSHAVCLGEVCRRLKEKHARQIRDR